MYACMLLKVWLSWRRQIDEQIKRLKFPISPPKCCLWKQLLLYFLYFKWIECDSEMVHFKPSFGDLPCYHMWWNVALLSRNDDKIVCTYFYTDILGPHWDIKLDKSLNFKTFKTFLCELRHHFLCHRAEIWRHFYVHKWRHIMESKFALKTEYLKTLYSK